MLLEKGVSNAELQLEAGRIAAKVEAVFSRYLVGPGDGRDRLFEAMRHAGLGGGKRIRPLLTVATGRLFGLSEDRLIRAGAAIERFRQASSEATSQVTGAIGDILGASTVLQAAGAEARAVNHLRKLNAERRTTVLTDRVASQAINGVTSNLVGVGAGLVMLLAAVSIRDGRLTVGDQVAGDRQPRPVLPTPAGPEGHDSPGPGAKAPGRVAGRLGLHERMLDVNGHAIEPTGTTVSP